MLIAVIGGKLQGVEAVYLAKKAGYRTVVIDKTPHVPVAGLCDQFLEFEFSLDNPSPLTDLKIDIILPAVEDETVLFLVKKWAEVKNIPLGFDTAAYDISNSKIKSNTLFHKMNLPIPESWPGCRFPVVVKPDQASGSHGVKIIDNPAALFSLSPDPQPSGSMIIQEFLDGPSCSIEVIGRPGSYHALQVTDLWMDKNYDCKKVTAPTQLSKSQISRFKKMAIGIAEEIRLTGIMDLEVILHKNKLKLLEIDARFPSQTPMTVYWSTGINMVEMLVHMILDQKINPEANHEQAALVEHIEVNGSKIEFSGEHIMALDGPLKRKTKFFGANEAVTSFRENRSHWVATMIFTGNSQKEIRSKRAACYQKIIAQTQNIS